MWLRYGVDINNTLVAIESTRSGKTNLGCPYCGNQLIAKKGRVKQHHFAHDGETCNLVIKREPRDLPSLPLYDALIKQDLRSHFKTVAINVLGTWSSRGNVEKYCKYKYSDFNHPIGSLTEYFQFVDPDINLAIIEIAFSNQRKQ